MFTNDIKENFKKIIIIFWMLWWLIALWTDVVGILAHYGLLLKSWAPDSNFPFLINALKMYPLPEWVPLLFLMGILFWSFLSTTAFVWAVSGLRQKAKVWMYRADIAFVISLSFWLAFFLADQLVMKFDLEENHMVQGGFQLLTYIMLYLLPQTRQ